VSELVGQTVKDYYVLRRLGQGAMAEVYLAQQLSLGRQVALKVLNAELARDPSYVQRFHHEARAAAGLVHAGIVQIYEVGQCEVGQGGATHFIAQEYVPGRNLGEVIHSRGRLEPALALDILRQVAGALAKASGAGIVHRDIKPENIMLSRSGEVKVADFGLARVQGDGGVNLTQIGITMGTPLYMSPEQVEGRPLDSRSDIYSLGVTAYHMLTGSPPFGGDTPLVVAMQHMNQAPKPLAALRADVPSGLAKVVHRMLAKQPADRFVDPSALLRELHILSKQGAEQGWANSPQDWSLSQLIAVADDRAVATATLDAVMKTSAFVTRKQPALGRRWFAGLVGCILLGGLVGWFTRPASLLADANAGPPPLKTVWAQLYQAKKVDTEAAWQAVAQHFPNADAYVHNLARQGLANFYLFRTEQFDKAIGPLRELAGLGALYPALEAYGIAGLVVAEAKLGNIAAARDENGKLTSPMRALLEERSPQLYELLEATLGELK